MSTERGSALSLAESIGGQVLFLAGTCGGCENFGKTREVAP